MLEYSTSHRRTTENEDAYLQKDRRIKRVIHWGVSLLLFSVFSLLVGVGILFIRMDEPVAVLIVWTPLFLLLAGGVWLYFYTAPVRKLRNKYAQKCSMNEVYRLEGILSSQWVGSLRHGHLEISVGSQKVQMPAHWLSQLNIGESVVVEGLFENNRQHFNVIGVEEHFSIHEEVPLGVLKIGWGVTPFIVIISLPFLFVFGVIGLDEVDGRYPERLFEAFDQVVSPADTIVNLHELQQREKLHLHESFYVPHRFRLYGPVANDHVLLVDPSTEDEVFIDSLKGELFATLIKRATCFKHTQKDFPTNLLILRDSSLFSVFSDNKEFANLVMRVQAIGLDSLRQMQNKALRSEDTRKALAHYREEVLRWFTPFKTQELKQRQVALDSTLELLWYKLEERQRSLGATPYPLYMESHSFSPKEKDIDAVPAWRDWYQLSYSGWYEVAKINDSGIYLQQSSAPAAFSGVIFPLLGILLAPLFMVSLFRTVYRFIRNRGIKKRIQTYYAERYPDRIAAVSASETEEHERDVCDDSDVLDFL